MGTSLKTGGDIVRFFPSLSKHCANKNGLLLLFPPSPFAKILPSCLPLCCDAYVFTTQPRLLTTPKGKKLW